jgi:WD40 repeat protein/predicted Ser/Thr protein kinase
MAISSGARLGPYEILSPLGAGGMGEVYKARDTRLERTVAVKVLPQRLSASPEARQRFEREAKTISQLSHPHICALYDVGREGETEYLVMEYLEGETLTERLAKEPLPLEQMLRYGVEIADALDKAHRQGIVHRDLKPSNVMLTKSGVKLLDFGLAKAMTPVAPRTSLTSLPTQQGLTQEGTILGTFQYMAPEQLEGKEADARTDLFAFGATLYEMATGRKAFSGTSQASLISSIMREDPAPISSVQPMSPPALDRVVKTCLAKDPEERWQSAHDVGGELEWIAEGGSQVGLPAPMTASRKGRERLLWMALAILALAALLPWVIRERKVARADPAVTRFAVLPPDNASFLGGEFDLVTISPDGRRLALMATSGGRRRIWIRPLESLTAEPLAGTEGASYPFWSPDSRFIGFFANGKLKKIEASGGPAQTLCDAPDGRGAAWNRDGVILFARHRIGEALYRVSSSGGLPVPATRLEPSRQESAHRWPCFLPDGRHFLYLASISTRHARNGIYIGSLDSRETTPLISADSNVAYSPTGHLLFVRDQTLMAQRFDAERLRPDGEVVPVLEQMPQALASSLSPFSVSENGVLAYWTGDTKRELVWFDQAGRRLGSLGSASDIPEHSLSPDDKRVALKRPDTRSGASVIWVVEVSRGVSSRLTLDRLEESFPIWSPDGTRIVFVSNRNGPEDLYQKDSIGTGREELLYKSDVVHKHPLDWSRDGRFILYQTRQPRTGDDIMALPLFGNREPIPFLSTEFEERHAQFSPDGTYVAYASDESGAYEIYVQPFPGPGEKLQISTQGGTQPRWRRDGKEIFYVAPDSRMMAAPLSPWAGSLNVGNPRALFKTTILPGALGPTSGYVVTADGQRFLIATPTSETLVFPVTVVLNWAAKLDP